ncbi:TPA: hypothetical protein I7721_19770 [Vibrio vulnificus]|nr:hypothetical protein [Vibrio vulnificus]
MKKMILLPVLLAALLTGCAVKNDNTKINGLGLSYQSDIQKTADGHYLASVESAPTAGRQSGAESQAIKNAASYCSAQNKAVKVIKTETDSHLVVNGVAHVTFDCK